MKSRLKNQSGQQTLEAILLMVAFLSMSMYLSRQFQQNAVFAQMLSQPWDYVRGMTESGVWSRSGVARSSHPNHVARHLSPVGERVNKP